MVGITLSEHMLNGTFATDKVTSLNKEANSINPSAFLPTRNTYMVNQKCLKDMISKTQSSMDILDAHKSKAKTSIAQVGTIVLVVDYSILCNNMDSFITAITTVDDPPPILHQFKMNFIKISTVPNGLVGTSQILGAFPFGVESSILLLIPWKGLHSHCRLCNQFWQCEHGFQGLPHSRVKYPAHYQGHHNVLGGRAERRRYNETIK